LSERPGRAAGSLAAAQAAARAAWRPRRRHAATVEAPRGLAARQPTTTTLLWMGLAWRRPVQRPCRRARRPRREHAQHHDSGTETSATLVCGLTPPSARRAPPVPEQAPQQGCTARSRRGVRQAGRQAGRQQLCRPAFPCTRAPRPGMGALLRSEPMVLVQLFVQVRRPRRGRRVPPAACSSLLVPRRFRLWQVDAAHDTVRELGETGGPPVQGRMLAPPPPPPSPPRLPRFPDACARQMNPGGGGPSSAPLSTR